MFLQHGYLTNPTGKHDFNTPGKISVSQTLRESFDAQFNRGKVGTWMIFSFLGMVLTTALITISQIVFNSAGYSYPTSDSVNQEASPTLMLIGYALLLVGMLVSIYFSVGVLKGYIRGYDSGNPRLGDLFVSDMSVVARVLGSSLLIGLISLLASLPIIIIFFVSLFAGGSSGTDEPTFIMGTMIFYVIGMMVVNGVISILMYFATVAIVDSGVGVMDSLKVSFNAAKKNFMPILGIVLVSLVILVVPITLVVFIMSLLGIVGAIIGAILSAIFFFTLYGPLNVVKISAYRQAVGGPTVSSTSAR